MKLDFFQQKIYHIFYISLSIKNSLPNLMCKDTKKYGIIPFSLVTHDLPHDFFIPLSFAATKENCGKRVKRNLVSLSSDSSLGNEAKKSGFFADMNASRNRL